MSHPSGYATPAALWRAVQDRSKARARVTGGQVQDVQRQFVYDRFLARLFTHAAAGTWILKGGTALLARVRSARHSRDIDLYSEAGTLDIALAELRAASGLDLVDHFHFVIAGGPPKLTLERPGQPGSELATVKVDGYVGTRQVPGFTVDVVVGVVITDEPDEIHPEPALALSGLPSPPYRLYPIVDHVADKLCATFEKYGATQLPSSRTRDLVDLVIIARSQHLDADLLRHAIEAERLHRGLEPIIRWDCPAQWARTYPGLARTVPECRDHRAFADASELVASLLDPVLSDGITSASWQPGAGWIPRR